jgi:hypothetical protein
MLLRIQTVTLAFSAAVLALGLTLAAQAQTVWYVDDDAFDDPGPGDPSVSDPDEDGSAGHPFDAIKEGIDATVNGDTVLVLAGTYTGVGNRHIDFGGKAITVKSEDGADTCIIDCAQAGRGFFFQSGETHDAVVDGFTITNGYVSLGNGGGIDCTLESAPTIRDCVLLNNTAHALGGGIACRGFSHAVITRCTFIGNASLDAPEGAQGGGLSLFVVSNAIVTDCVFIDNYSLWGGAVDCSGSFPVITNCLFVDNTASIGGGAVFCSGADPVITNCTFTRNTSPNGGALVLAGAVLESYPVLTNCILWNDGPEEIVVGIGSPTVTYSDVENGWPGPGNIDESPVFVGDTVHHASPCIDAGDNDAVPHGIDTDLDGCPRFVDNPDTEDTGHGTPPLVDMGAYEFQVAIPGDLNADGCVDQADLGILLASFGVDAGGDLDNDDDTDQADLGILLAHWGEGCR